MKFLQWSAVAWTLMIVYGLFVDKSDVLAVTPIFLWTMNMTAIEIIKAIQGEKS